MLAATLGQAGPFDHPGERLGWLDLTVQVLRGAGEFVGDPRHPATTAPLHPDQDESDNGAGNSEDRHHGEDVDNHFSGLSHCSQDKRWGKVLPYAGAHPGNPGHYHTYPVILLAGCQNIPQEGLDRVRVAHIRMNVC